MDTRPAFVVLMASGMLCAPLGSVGAGARIGCVIVQTSTARVLNAEGKVIVLSRSRFGDPYPNCIGLKVDEGKVDILTATADGSRMSSQFLAGSIVTEASLTRNVAPVSESWFSVLSEILSGTTGEALGVSRGGAEGDAAQLQRYLGGKVTWRADSASYDLRALGLSTVKAFSVVTKNARRQLVEGVVLDDGVLSIRADTLEAGRTYAWTASVGGVHVAGDLQVLEEQESLRVRGEIRQALTVNGPGRPSELAKLAAALWTAQLRLDALGVAQGWVDDRGR